MRILVTGSKGQLGKELCETLSLNKDIQVIGHDRDTLDITNWSEVLREVESIKPNVIINTAAYTNVDACETDYRGAHAVNVIGAMHMARAAEIVGAKIIHISTDFVFDGKKGSDYFEYDATNPLSVYGKTKLAGEWAVRNECRNHFIIRTSWLYGKYGNNFVKTMIKIGKQNDEIKVVTDQVGSPTYATDLVSMIEKCLNSETYGVYHFSNKGHCSWNEFAKEIFVQMKMKTLVNETTSVEFIRPAARPPYSVMDTAMIQATLKFEIADWKKSLKIFIEKNKTTLLE